MKFVPNYNVSYHGDFYRAGHPIEINQEDVQEMSKHGTFVTDIEQVSENSVDEEPKRKPGRPKKSENE